MPTLSWYGATCGSIVWRKRKKVRMRLFSVIPISPRPILCYRMSAGAETSIGRNCKVWMPI